MNQQFIQSLSIDWNKIEDDSYLREIEAINYICLFDYLFISS